eukprot:CAMPEP_0172691618 /NCGR_PEP_ID=MMETSP1074-20121228/24679_1 /TAXON_ID=2916 /ORGANISM="Ceratium fusus, Strain PA161109" /LENGTH=37 /DNA_ID= /DNA_START= /DNA_END= /DNA_ORIENTATION=
MRGGHGLAFTDRPPLAVPPKQGKEDALSNVDEACFCL